MVTFAVRVHNLRSPLLMPATRSKYAISSGLISVGWSQPHRARLLRLEQSWPNRQLEKVVECAKGGSASASELGDEIVTEEELMGLGKLGGKCEETRGIAELLECLEREAIMGERMKVKGPLITIEGLRFFTRVPGFSGLSEKVAPLFPSRSLISGEGSTRASSILKSV